MGIFSFESLALALLVVALAAFLAWRQMRWAAKPVEDNRDQREEGKNIINFSDPPSIVIKDFQDAQAKYNDTEHEQPCASMEPMCGGRDDEAGNLAKLLAQVEADRQARCRQAVRHAQLAAWNAQHREKVQHNSSFRAMGMTPVSIFPDDDLIAVFDVRTQKHVLVPDSWVERK